MLESENDTPLDTSKAYIKEHEVDKKPNKPPNMDKHDTQYRVLLREAREKRLYWRQWAKDNPNKVERNRLELLKNTDKYSELYSTWN